MCCGVLGAQNLIPQPQHFVRGAGEYVLSAHTQIYCKDFPDLERYANLHIEHLCGYRLHSAVLKRPVGQITIERSGHSEPAEGYTLRVTSQGVLIRGNDRAGCFYGLQTLFQLMPADIYRPAGRGDRSTCGIVACDVEDAPRFGYRGVMLDVARTFFDKEFVMRYIDWMAYHKINMLHWHLTDDEGWRVEIRSHPELTSKGAWRGPSEVRPSCYGSGERRYGGYYTQHEIREIVRYAALRNVQIIPEIDLPGHSQVLCAVYPEMRCTPQEGVSYPEGDQHDVVCVTRDENYTVIEDILRELAELFPSPYIHIGGDEVNAQYWRDCTRCRARMAELGMKDPAAMQRLFVDHLVSILHRLGKRCAAWDEVARNDSAANRETLIYGWRSVERCREAVGNGYRVVAMPGAYCYIDMQQHLWDRGHTWAWRVNAQRLYDFDPLDGLSSTDAPRICGVEAALWSELLHPARFVEYQSYPRLAALAELGWSQPSVRDWGDFYRRLTAGHFSRLGAMGIRFCAFPPEVEYAEGLIRVKGTPTEGSVRFTDDLSTPSSKSPRYEDPIRTDHPERYRFRLFSDGGVSTDVWPTVRVAQSELLPHEHQTFTIPLSQWAPHDGIWLLSFDQLKDNLMITRMEVKGVDTSYVIIRNGQKVNPLRELRVYVDSLSRGANLLVTLRNDASAVDRVALSLRPSPWIEPPVRVTSSIPCLGRFPLASSEDYNFTSYTRSQRACHEGDYILYTFEEPVACWQIDVRTGIPDIPRYIVTRGEVAWSSDGERFEHTAPLDAEGCALLHPSRPVKSVRIAIHGLNGESLLAWQDLRVVPRFE